MKVSGVGDENRFHKSPLTFDIDLVVVDHYIRIPSVSPQEGQGNSVELVTRTGSRKVH